MSRFLSLAAIATALSVGGLSLNASANTNAAGGCACCVDCASCCGDACQGPACCEAGGCCDLNGCCLDKAATAGASCSAKGVSACCSAK